MPETTLTRARVAAMVDHTLLKPEASGADVRALVDEARELGVWSVCVSPSMLPLRADGLVVATVAGFPSGKHHSLIKGAEARLAVDQGAAEIDMVIDIGAAVAGGLQRGARRHPHRPGGDRVRARAEGDPRVGGPVGRGDRRGVPVRRAGGRELRQDVHRVPSRRGARPCTRCG